LEEEGKTQMREPAQQSFFLRGGGMAQNNVKQEITDGRREKDKTMTGMVNYYYLGGDTKFILAC
jgi:hypothetical protein